MEQGSHLAITQPAYLDPGAPRDRAAVILGSEWHQGRRNDNQMGADGLPVGTTLSDGCRDAMCNMISCITCENVVHIHMWDVTSHVEMLFIASTCVQLHSC